MVTKKEDTPSRMARRKYEEKHKDVRREKSSNFQTMIPKDLYNEVTAFLDRIGMSKVNFIKEAYKIMKGMKENGIIKFNENEISLIEDDITRLDVDAIVNAANNSLLGGGGVDGAIHYAAGNELYEECKTLNGCKTGEAKITKGYKLKARHVIHTVGPIYQGVKEDSKLLSNCYMNSLNLAKENGVKSIAFPCISTGVYGYPMEEAVEVVMKTIEKWCVENADYGMKIIICCYGEEAYNSYKGHFE